MVGDGEEVSNDRINTVLLFGAISLTTGVVFKVQCAAFFLAFPEIVRGPLLLGFDER